ncbi:MAG: serine protease [Patescibacteria group bacterium]|nr:serine protease [Patescibacteria group bacterium]
MSVPEIITEVSSGIVSITFLKAGSKIASGSAFLAKDMVISNNHIFHPGEGSFAPDVIVKLKVDNSEFTFKYSDLASYVVCGSPQEHDDYIVLDIRDNNFFKSKYQFELGTHKDIRTGEQVLIMGYPFEQEQLTSHIGYISAQYLEGGVNIMQLDASVNNGNSGGPLIDLRTKNVVGIITRKATGLVKQFDDLMDTFDKNAEILQKLEGIAWGGLTIGKILATSQQQMNEIAKNIKRSANVGIGYAFSCDKLKLEIE